MLKHPRLKILLRRTENWDKLSPAEHYTQVKEKLTSGRPYYKPEVYLANLIRWEDSFAIPYTTYRQYLKDLSFQSFKATGLKIETPLALNKGEQFVSKPYLTTDDDDWYHPNIGLEVDQYFRNPKIKLVYWKAWVFHLSENSTYEGKMFSVHTENNGKWMASNGYAVRDKRWVCYVTHNYNTIQNLHPDEYVFVDKPLSVWVQHPASIWELQSFSTPNDKFIKIQPIPNELKWAERYIRISYKITQSLKKAP